MTPFGKTKGPSREKRDGELERLRNRVSELEARLRASEAKSAQSAADLGANLGAQSRLAVTLDSIADAVITTDPNGFVERLNPIAERLTGFKQQDALGRMLSEVFRVGKTHRASEAAMAIATTGAHSTTTLDPITLWDKQGNPHTIELSASSIRGAGREVHGTVLVFRDVTERREYEARKLQSDKLQALGQLVGGLAHELNNLFAATMSYGELLRLKFEACPDAEAEQHAESVIENTRRASELVGRLLAFARERPRESAPLDVHHVIEDVVERGTDLPGDVVLELHLDANDSYVRGDAQALRDSLRNLIINASESMPQGGTVRISTRETELSAEQCKRTILPAQPGRYFCVEVADCGVGIPDALISRVFEPFFTTKTGGTIAGLGLSVVYGTMRDHGGTIEIESRANHGTAFRTYLPMQGEIPIGSLRPSHQLVPGHGRILLVDDEPSLRRAGAALLRRLGYEVALAEDGVQAIEVFRQDPKSFDLVLLDIMMPRLNGRDALKAMRRIEPSVKAFYISAFGLSSDDPSEEDGVQGVIRKPFTAATLSQRIAEVLESARID